MTIDGFLTFLFQTGVYEIDTHDDGTKESANSIRVYDDVWIGYDSLIMGGYNWPRCSYWC